MSIFDELVNRGKVLRFALEVSNHEVRSVSLHGLHFTYYRSNYIVGSGSELFIGGTSTPAVMLVEECRASSSDVIAE